MELPEQEHLIRRSRWRLYLTLGTFVALAVLIYALRHQIAGVIDNLGRVNTWALVVMIPLEAWNYDTYARMYRGFFAILDKKVDYWPMYRLTLELNFVNHILPSGGISGISYFNVRMRAFGVSGAKSTLSQLMKNLLLYVSFQPILVLGLFLLAIRGHVNNLVMTVASIIVTMLVIGTFGFIYMIESRARTDAVLTFFTKAINKLLSWVRRHPETIKVETARAVFGELHDNYQLLKRNWPQLKMPFVYMILANATEIAALYMVYIAFDRFVNVGAVILAYAVANFAGLISILPAGIGIYEGLMTAVLVATGIPAEVSIPVTIMYRVVNMFIQLTPGYFFYQRAVKSGLTTKQ